MLKRLSNHGDEHTKGTLAMMVHTVRLEKEMTTGASYLDCFRGTNLRRTEICCLTFAGQVMSGSTFAYGPTYFFEQAGMAPSNAYKMNVGGTALAFTGTVLSWFLISRFGRRTLYLSGIGTLTVLLLIIGIIAATTSHGPGLWVQAGFTVFWLFIYSLTVGPLAYAIISETSAIRLRAQTVCLARNSYNITNIISNVLEPYMINPTEWNWYRLQHPENHEKEANKRIGRERLHSSGQALLQSPLCGHTSACQKLAGAPTKNWTYCSQRA